MTSILSLPPELMEIIYDELSDLLCKKQLRLTCRRINAVGETILLSNIKIDLSRHRLEVATSQLDDIVKGSTKAPKYAQKLTIACLAPSAMKNDPTLLASTTEIAAAEKTIMTRLLPALMSFKNVRKAVWVLQDSDLAYARSCVICALSSMENLQHFELDIGAAQGPMPLHRLPSLTCAKITGFDNYALVQAVKEITAKSTNLRVLHVKCVPLTVRRDPAPTLADLLSGVQQKKGSPILELHLSGFSPDVTRETIPHLASLTSLNLRCIPDFRDSNIVIPGPQMPLTDNFEGPTQRFWNGLLESKVRLQVCCTSRLEIAQLHYLASYSGLERLEYVNVTSRNPTPDCLADMFYKDILPSHSSSLRVLEILPKYDGKWCYSPLSENVLASCKNLVCLRLGFSVSQHEDDPKYNAVHSMLQMASSLPYLRHLTIAAIPTEHVSTYHYGLQLGDFLREADHIIDQEILGFTPTCVSTFIIMTASHTYGVEVNHHSRKSAPSFVQFTRNRMANGLPCNC